MKLKMKVCKGECGNHRGFCMVIWTRARTDRHGELVRRPGGLVRERRGNPVSLCYPMCLKLSMN